jgi:hypothetical protein
MAATHQWSESNLVGEVITDGISNINFGSNDSPNIITVNYPITIGQNSFSKYIRGKFTGVWTTISNMKFWKSSGNYVTGESIKAGANIAYATPSQVGTIDSDVPILEGSALSVNSFEGASTIESGVSGVSGYTGYIRLQLRTTGSTPAGAVNQKQFTFQYDEI